MEPSKRTSLFAQRMSKKNERKAQNAGHRVQSYSNLFGEKSCMITGNDAETIHQENINKLARMSTRDIEEERSKLLAEMDPALVTFIQSKKLKQKDVVVTSNRNEEQQQFNFSKSTVISGKTPAVDLLNKWPHMDVVETEKMQWMEELPSSNSPPSVPYNARFNFDGTLLPYTEDIPQAGLYHHGEEPERPGYTLQELMQLSRSSVLQQRVTALNALANILRNASDYTNCLVKPLLPQLLDSEIFLLLRFSLDDPNRQVITAAVAAICNLLVNYKDESCLDRLLGLGTGIQQPLLHVQIDLKPEEIAELKDPQLLKLDVIRGALRTHILPRFSYILNTLRAESVEAVNIVNCLIRIARHSLESALAIANCPQLLYAVRCLLNKENVYNYPEALKLFRVLACYSSNFAEQLVQNYQLMEPIQRYISGEKREGLMSLVLESFYTWQTLLAHKLTIDVFISFSPILRRLFLTHAETTSIDSRPGDQEHATALMSILLIVLRIDYASARDYVSTVEFCALKWLYQISAADEISWTVNKMLGIVLNCVATVVASGGRFMIDFPTVLHVFISSYNFKINCSNNLRKSSWLLFDYQDNKVDSLPCLGAVSPTVYPTSTLPLVSGLAAYLHVSANPKMSETFISFNGIKNYVQEIIEKRNIQARTAHWFARQEIFLLYSILNMHLHTVNISENSFVHEVALILASAVHSDDKHLLPHLFEKFIFNSQFFRPDLSSMVAQFENIKLNDKSRPFDEREKQLLAEAVESLDNISACYSSILGLQSPTFAAPPSPLLMASPQGVEPALPSDWQFIPILQLYNSEGNGVNALSVATASLQWILIIEMLRPKIASATSVAARFCRLACTFLAGNDLFRDITQWLQSILAVLLRCNSQLDFDEPIPGLSSFYDFFRQLMEQFCAVSYGNQVFGQYLLVPLQQKHNCKYRKIIWSEQAGALRFLSTPVNQLGVPLKEFLEPCETDNDLLGIYLTSLATGRVQDIWCPVLYRVAVHHVATFVKLYSEHPFAKILLQKIHSLGNQQLGRHLLEYSYSEECA